MANILIVEDHDDLREVVAHNVTRWGHRAIEAANANDALIELDDYAIDLILLDLMLPGLSGVQFLDILRKSEKTGAVPVIITSIINQEDEIVAALNAGADDYVAKPYSFAYLQAKVTSLLRRSEGRAAPSTFRGVKLRADTHDVCIDGAPVALTPKEFTLLSLFLKNPGKIFTREILLAKVWGYDAGMNTRTVDAHVSSLRKKLGAKGSLIKSVSKIGYGAEL